MRSILLFQALLFLVFEKGFAQCPTISAELQNQSLTNTIKYYLDSVQARSVLYRGEPHTQQYSNSKHPFLLENQWKKASLKYDGIFYPDVQLKYDIVDDALVINANEWVEIILDKEKIEFFEIYDRVFIPVKNQGNDVGPTFYELRVCGEVSFLVKREKKPYVIKEYPNIRTEYIPNDKFYLLGDGMLLKVRKKNSVLKAFEGSEKVLKQFVKKEKLSFYQYPEDAISETVSFYNSTIASK